MKKKVKGCLTWSTLVFLLALVFGFFVFRHLGMRSGKATTMIRGAKTISLILRGLSMDQTDGKDEWMVWPRSSGSGTCSNSTAFLRRLQKDPPIETLLPRMFEDMQAGPHAAASERCFFMENGESRWTILLDTSEETPDFVPLILSRGIDVAVLCDLLANSPPASRKVRLLEKDDEWGVLHFKDWKILFLNNQSFEVRKRALTMARFGITHPPYTATYLTPTGLVSVTFRSP